MTNLELSTGLIPGFSITLSLEIHCDIYFKKSAWNKLETQTERTAVLFPQREHLIGVVFLLIDQNVVCGRKLRQDEQKTRAVLEVHTETLPQPGDRRVDTETAWAVPACLPTGRVQWSPS